MEDARLALELPDGRVDAGRLHDAPLLGDVAVEDGQPPVGAVGVLDVADAARGTVAVRLGEVFVLRKGHGGGDVVGSGEGSLSGGSGCRWAGNVVFVDGRVHRAGVHGADVAVDQFRAVELSE